MKLRRTKCDALFSEYIRTRDNWTCRKCGVRYEPPTNALHCAHFIGRGNRSVRFEPMNAITLCYGHHAYFDSNPLEKVEFFTKLLGAKTIEHLKIQSKVGTWVGKRQEPLMCEWLKRKIKELQKAEGMA